MKRGKGWANLGLIVLVVGCLSAWRGFAQEKIYNEEADAKAEIARAAEKARRDNKRVLLVYGGNWCGWCRKLHQAFTQNRDIARVLLYEYEVVRVDIGRFDKNLDIAEKYGSKIKKGVPYLTVLGGDGEVLTHQETGVLEKEGSHDPGLVKTFLEKWRAEPLDAETVLEESLSRAKKEKKRLFVHLGAPW